MVSSFSSSASGPRAGLLPLEVIPMNRSIFSVSLRRRISLVLASSPAASSALRISIFLLPRRPPFSLISSAANRLPWYIGSPRTAPALGIIAQTLRGIWVGLRSGKRVVLAVTGAVFVFNLVAPVAVLSLARRPPDFFSFNPWLSRLPEYLASEEPLAKKLSFLSQMAIAWVSADNKVEGIDWGFIVDVPTLARIVLASLVFGAYFALWSYRRRQGAD